MEKHYKYMVIFCHIQNSVLIIIRHFITICFCSIHLQNDIIIVLCSTRFYNRQCKIHLTITQTLPNNGYLWNNIIPIMLRNVSQMLKLNIVVKSYPNVVCCCCSASANKHWPLFLKRKTKNGVLSLLFGCCISFITRVIFCICIVIFSGRENLE